MDPISPPSGHGSGHGCRTGARMDTANAAHPSALQHVVGELSERDQEVLDFERQWWKYAGAKEQAVREKFDMSSTRYYQVLNALIDRPEALAHDPLLVRDRKSTRLNSSHANISYAVFCLKKKNNTT